jgi:hypothetical protein
VRGSHLLGKDQAILMPTVVDAVVRRGCAFSGDATARVVGDVGADVTGHRGSSVSAP